MGDIDVVGTARTAEDATRLVTDLVPDVMLLDLELPAQPGERPSLTGPGLCDELARTHPGLAIVVVTAHDDPELLRRCLAFGARAVVVKRDESDPDRIAHAVRAAFRGDITLDLSLQALVGQLARSAYTPAEQVGLTPREQEILPLVAIGMLNKEIAARLSIGNQSVRNHISSILRKLGAKNRTEAVAIARGLQILP